MKKILLFLVLLCVVPLAYAEQINDVLYVNITDTTIMLQFNNSLNVIYSYPNVDGVSVSVPMSYHYNSTINTVFNYTGINEIKGLLGNLTVNVNDTQLNLDIGKPTSDLKAWMENTYLPKTDELKSLSDSNVNLQNEVSNLKVVLNSTKIGYEARLNNTVFQVSILQESLKLRGYIIIGLVFIMLLTIFASIKEFNWFGFKKAPV